MLGNSKLVHLNGKILTCFIQNLVYNLKNVVLHVKVTRSSQKMAKTKTVWKNTYMQHSQSKG